ncbi:MAG TPA: hypothetical protein VHR55_04540 [Candidatus Limnocylindria bacterium]|nr:hypothetical protein [Candidatus Limnocylindria bacterium]
MRLTLVLAALTGLCAGCGLVAPTPPGPPSLEVARWLLDDLVEAGIARDFARLCGLAASDTCEHLLEGHEDLAPAAAPTIVQTDVYPPESAGNGFTGGGVLFVLCGTDAAGAPFESELLVSRNLDGTLFAVPAVWWTGTRVIVGADPADVGGEPAPDQGRCP